MKTRLILLFTFISLLSFQTFAADRKVKGNGNVITRQISIRDYETINLAGNMQVTYEQSESAPYLEITTDDNLFEYIDVKQDGKELSIRPETIHNNSYSLEPTVYRIKTNSKNLAAVNFAGSGSFNINSGLKTDNLTFNSAGSGSLSANNPLVVKKLKVNGAGSGKVVFKQIQAEELNCSVAGSATMDLGGTAGKASYSTAGSAKIQAYDCRAENVKASTAGSGTIHLYAVEKLNASVAGNGNITYAGSPVVDSSVHGSGKIKSRN